MEKIIIKAIEGNWKPKYEFATEWNSIIRFTDDGSILLVGENGKILGTYNKENIVLDPLFWQALGKSCDFTGTKCYECARCVYPIGQLLDLDGDPCCLHIAMTFHELNLTESWESAVKWLENLITN